MSVTANKSSLIFGPYNGERNIIDITYTGDHSYTSPTISVGWVQVSSQVISTTGETDVIRYTVDTTSAYSSTGGSYRSGYLEFEDTSGELRVYIYQYGSYRCIWVDIPPSSSMPGSTVGQDFVYRLKVGSKVIYEGVSVATASNRYPRMINIPRIVESYIKSETYNTYDYDNWNTIMGSEVVELYKVEGDTETIVGVYPFWNDWSGSLTYYMGNKVLNDPINCRGNRWMFPINFCTYTSNISTADYKVTQIRMNGTVDGTYDFGDYEGFGVYPFDFNYDQGTSNCKTLIYKNGNDVLFEYDMDCCGFGALYYRNRYGAWDSFLIEGNVRKKEAYTRNQYRTEGLTGNVYDSMFSKTTEGVDIVTSYEAETGWLTEEESQRLVYHLLSSPIVYFQEIDPHRERMEADDISYIAVNITNTASEYKKFRNGRKMVRYTITFEKSQKNIVKQ